MGNNKQLLSTMKSNFWYFIYQIFCEVLHLEAICIQHSSRHGIFYKALCHLLR